MHNDLAAWEPPARPGDNAADRTAPAVVPPRRLPPEPARPLPPSAAHVARPPAPAHAALPRPPPSAEYRDDRSPPATQPEILPSAHGCRNSSRLTADKDLLGAISNAGTESLPARR